MPDRETAVRTRLVHRRISRSLLDRTARDLAGHLEDLELEFRKDSIEPEEAAARAWSQFDWPLLQKELIAMEHNARVQRIWIPALISSALFVALLFILGRGLITWRWHDMLLFFSWPFTAGLLPAGSLAAWFARQRGASPKEILAATTFPGLAWTSLLLVVMLVAVFIDHLLTQPLHLAGAGVALFLWGLAPTLALALGATPFLRGKDSSHAQEFSA